MKFFLDTANLDELRQGVAMGIIDGITTNPSLVAKTGQTFHSIATQVAKLIDGPVNLEVISDDHEGMLREARELVKYGKNVVVKIPMTPEGMIAVKELKKKGVRTNVTLIFSPAQALIAAKAGASYVSPFLGRLDDIGQDGMDIIHQIRQVFDNYDIDTEILAASIRHPIHVLDCALAGADICTMPFSTLQRLFHHPLTDKGIEIFKADYAKIPAAVTSDAAAKDAAKAAKAKKTAAKKGGKK
ncbi:fructose-6-phosphate aldolase [bacterium]|nr:fructose-6-phosphate aldolase [bacterium]